MALQIRPDYVNPLTLPADKKESPRLGRSIAGQSGQTDEVTELRNKKQQLQTQMLLLKATGTDGAGTTEETQKVVEEELERVAAELRDAKGDGVQTGKQTEDARPDSRFIAVRRRWDLYEPERADTASSSIYRIEKDGKIRM